MRRDREQHRRLELSQLWARLTEVYGESLPKDRGVRAIGRLKQDRWASPAGRHVLRSRSWPSTWSSIRSSKVRTACFLHASIVRAVWRPAWYRPPLPCQGDFSLIDGMMLRSRRYKYCSPRTASSSSVVITVIRSRSGITTRHCPPSPKAMYAGWLPKAWVYQ
jgi:hypothetical protein